LNKNTKIIERLKSKSFLCCCTKKLYHCQTL